MKTLEDKYGNKYEIEGTELKSFIPIDGDNLTAEIPERITKIGYAAFGSCDKVKKVVMPNSVVEILYGAFENCTSLTDINLSTSLEFIGASAFGSCALISVSIPNSGKGDSARSI